MARVRVTAYLSLPSTVIDVPREGGELHGQNHLGTGDLHGFVAESVDCADDVAGKHISRAFSFIEWNTHLTVKCPMTTL